MADRIRPYMERSARAKQFQPFDALKGFREALAEKEREAAPRKELSPERIEEIDYKLHKLQKGDFVTVEYFSDGAYLRIMGEVSRSPGTDGVLEINERKIPLDDISEVL